MNMIKYDIFYKFSWIPIKISMTSTNYYPQKLSLRSKILDEHLTSFESHMHLFVCLKTSNNIQEFFMIIVTWSATTVHVPVILIDINKLT